MAIMQRSEKAAFIITKTNGDNYQKPLKHIDLSGWMAARWFDLLQDPVTELTGPILSLTLVLLICFAYYRCT